MNQPSKWLGKDVGKLRACMNIQKINKSITLLIASKVAIHLNMFGLLMKDRVTSNVNGSLIVTKYRNRSGNRNTQISQQKDQPN